MRVGWPALVVLAAGTVACERNRDRDAAGEPAQPVERVAPAKPAEPPEPPTGTADAGRAGEPTSTGAAAGAAGMDAAAPKGEEGRITMRLLGDRKGSVEYAFKGDKVRVGVRGTGEDMDAIVDRSDKKLTLLLRDQKKYATVDLDRMMQRARQAAEKLEVTKTGKQERVAGITCEWWEFADGKRKVSACVSKGPSYFDPETAERITGVDLPVWAERIAEEGYFPVRVNVTDAGGKQTPVMELERWTESPVEAGDFQVPKDYQPVKPEELRQGIQKRVNPAPR